MVISAFNSICSGTCIDHPWWCILFGFLCNIGGRLWHSNLTSGCAQVLASNTVCFSALLYSRATGRAFRPSFISRYIQHLHNHSWKLTQQPYWRDKIGQYSLIKDYDRRSTKMSFVACLKNLCYLKCRIVSSSTIQQVKEMSGYQTA
jgi:hypothetical protein